MCEQKLKFGGKYVEQCRRHTKQNIPNNQQTMKSKFQCKIY